MTSNRLLLRRLLTSHSRVMSPVFERSNVAFRPRTGGSPCHLVLQVSSSGRPSPGPKPRESSSALALGPSLCLLPISETTLKPNIPDLVRSDLSRSTEPYGMIHLNH